MLDAIFKTISEIFDNGFNVYQTETCTVSQTSAQEETVNTLRRQVAERDKEMAELRKQLERSIQLDPETLPAQVADRMRALSTQQDEETEQGQINALRYGRAAIALDSDPYAECFKDDVQVDYIARESGKSIPAFLKERPVPPVVPPRTNGGRIRAMTDMELARFLADTGASDAWRFGNNVDAWKDWLRSDAD